MLHTPHASCLVAGGHSQLLPASVVPCKQFSAGSQGLMCFLFWVQVIVTSKFDNRWVWLGCCWAVLLQGQVPPAHQQIEPWHAVCPCLSVVKVLCMCTLHHVLNTCYAG